MEHQPDAAERIALFETMYASGEVPWDTGGPQPALVELADRGLLAGRVIDVGCGTGENALMLAARGCEVVGIDPVDRAIRAARKKARARGLQATFLVANALEMASPDPPFDAAVDSGVFHVFSDADRPRYVAFLHRALRPGGRLALMCFSELEPGDQGPRRVSRPELEAAFADGWTIESLERTRFEHRVEPGYAQGWRMVARRN